ncbi:GNAT family N-acetyltransferase [Burkholderia glumae]|uniref:GNAT family N-acetyltransferase n=3 Tax=Burkholderia glumae TaxID=337 RepID=A0AAP9XYS5_BURGL|nr:N-acetyltransferase [Burkholderia glumae]ACR32398.1 GNAT family acetyltransferase [Burkholderia glumae BGR1]AJY63457.1 acetyltransferase family protein [Burkholderia glumae LMG 2196 = ATCC 33617]MCM2484417.1 GNAT family N-acetyltransferase [Burkholderia glumae]MCM2494784.1 GNAT family N-acetyltransferase [Burkholderia glumae]MCM2510109.1 GNAT family N-acetyltransferase [Burkholderia glumae]
MITIRPMTDADFDRFWPIFQTIAAAQESYAYEPALTKEAARALWIDLPSYTFLAEEAGELLGSYYLKPNAAGPGAHVCNCGYMVAPAARGKGVARRMCEHSLRKAREAGFLAMQFNSVVSTNEVAVALWKKMGFAVVGTLPRAYRHRTLGYVDCFVMYRWLGEPAAA